MSWEHIKYKATCDGCGHEGVRIDSSDDWGGSKTAWEGFNNVAPDTTAVGRKRAGAGDMRPKCPNCGGTAISRGDYLGTT